MPFENAKEIVELAGLFMVVLPALGLGVLALAWRAKRKGQ